MMTKNKFSYLLWNSVTESADKRYRHHLIKVYANKQNDFVAEMTSYVQKAHEDAKQYIRRALGDPLDPLEYSKKVFLGLNIWAKSSSALGPVVVELLKMFLNISAS